MRSLQRLPCIWHSLFVRGAKLRQARRRSGGATFSCLRFGSKQRLELRFVHQAERRPQQNCAVLKLRSQTLRSASGACVLLRTANGEQWNSGTVEQSKHVRGTVQSSDDTDDTVRTTAGAFDRTMDCISNSALLAP